MVDTPDAAASPAAATSVPETAPTLLVTLTGKDRPGVTTTLMAALAGHDVDVLDVEQIVIRGRLVLGVLLTRDAAEEAAVEETVRKIAAELVMDVELEPKLGDAKSRPAHRSHITVLGNPLRPAALAAMTQRIARCGGNIDRIVRIARYPVTAIELQASGCDPAALRAALAVEAAAQDVDVAVQPAGLARRAKRLIVMDVDSTLIQDEVIELIAAHAGVLDTVADVTDRAMRGEIDFETSLRERVALLAGLDASVLDTVRGEVRLTRGARTLCRTLHRLGYRIAIVSGGFTHVTDALAEELGIDHAHANELEIVDGKLTGGIVGDVVDRAGKAAALERFAEAEGIPLSQTVAIGDGANDLDMIERAGLGVAFNAKPLVREAADATINVPYLDAILYLLGITRDEIEAADAEAGAPTPAPPVPVTRRS
jgi:phosphoserine phosphatase